VVDSASRICTNKNELDAGLKCIPEQVRIRCNEGETDSGGSCTVLSDLDIRDSLAGIKSGGEPGYRARLSDKQSLLIECSTQDGTTLCNRPNSVV
jgi:hypothetical protein